MRRLKRRYATPPHGSIAIPALKGRSTVRGSLRDQERSVWHGSYCISVPKPHPERGAHCPLRSPFPVAEKTIPVTTIRLLRRRGRRGQTNGRSKKSGDDLNPNDLTAARQPKELFMRQILTSVALLAALLVTANLAEAAGKHGGSNQRGGHDHPNGERRGNGYQESLRDEIRAMVTSTAAGSTTTGRIVTTGRPTAATASTAPTPPAGTTGMLREPSIIRSATSLMPHRRSRLFRLPPRSLHRRPWLP